MITVLKRNVNILSCVWTMPTGIKELFTYQEPADVENRLRSADLLIYIDRKLVGYAKITESQVNVYFDINLNATNSHFTISTVVTNQASRDISTNLQIYPTSQGGSPIAVINRESLFVDVSSEFVTCEVISKSAKINPTFNWDRTIDEGLDISSATEILQTWRQFKPFFWDDLFLLSITIDEEGISKESFEAQVPFGDHLLSSCPCPKYHGEWTGKTRGTIPKCFLPAPTLTVVNGSGSATLNSLYAYQIVPITAEGGVLNPSQMAITSVGPSVLNDLDYIKLNWESVSGATYYRIYRVNIRGYTSGISTGLLTLLPATVTSYNDVGLEAQSSTSTLQAVDHSYSGVGTYKVFIQVTVDGIPYSKTLTVNVT